jgi:hypothetical protein
MLASEMPFFRSGFAKSLILLLTACWPFYLCFQDHLLQQLPCPIPARKRLRDFPCQITKSYYHPTAEIARL